MDNGFSEAGSAFAIVSPCSQCKNQLAEQSADGKPFCPRRKWQQDLETYKQKNNGAVDPRMALLATSGTEGTSAEGDHSLRNPVYLDDGKTSLVWIATLRDNSGVRDADNNVIAPQILDPKFIPDSTEYIHCRPTPYIPALHEAAYRQSGGLKEGDQVFVVTAQNQQHGTIPEQQDDDSNVYRPVLVEGVISKVNLVFRTPRAKVGVDFTVEGT